MFPTSITDDSLCVPSITAALLRQELELDVHGNGLVPSPKSITSHEKWQGCAAPILGPKLCIAVWRERVLILVTECVQVDGGDGVNFVAKTAIPSG